MERWQWGGTYVDGALKNIKLLKEYTEDELEKLIDEYEKGMNSIQNELDYLNQLKFSVSQFLYDIDEPMGTENCILSDEQIFSLTEKIVARREQLKLILDR